MLVHMLAQGTSGGGKWWWTGIGYFCQGGAVTLDTCVPQVSWSSLVGKAKPYPQPTLPPWLDWMFPGRWTVEVVPLFISMFFYFVLQGVGWTVLCEIAFVKDLWVFHQWGFSLLLFLLFTSLSPWRAAQKSLLSLWSSLTLFCHLTFASQKTPMRLFLLYLVEHCPESLQNDGC